MSLITGNKGKIFAKDDVGRVRKAQEDSHDYKLGTPNGDLFVVCDGMGGHVGGATASRIAVDSIIDHIGREKYATPVEALDGALQFANMQILGHADAHPELKGMGTTACIVLIQGVDVWIAHVGDSRIYLYLGKEHQLHRITKDHSYVQTLVDAGEITDEEAEHHPNKNRIMKALGIKPELHPTFNYENKPIHPKNGDIFLICSDGLCGMIPDKTIERVLGEDLTLQQKGEQLIKLAMEGETVVPGGQDNCTVELIEIDNSKWKKSEFKSYNPNHVPEKRSKKAPAKVFRSLKIAAISITVLMALGAAGWWLVKAHNDKEATPKNTIENKNTSLKEEIDNLVNDTVVLTNTINSINEKAGNGNGELNQDDLDTIIELTKVKSAKINTINAKQKKLNNQLSTMKK